jgi:hypothetical protein
MAGIAAKIGGGMVIREPLPLIYVVDVCWPFHAQKRPVNSLEDRKPSPCIDHRAFHIP